MLKIIVAGLDLLKGFIFFSLIACLVGGKSGKRERGEGIEISGRILRPMVVW